MINFINFALKLHFSNVTLYQTLRYIIHLNFSLIYVISQTALVINNCKCMWSSNLDVYTEDFVNARITVFASIKRSSLCETGLEKSVILFIFIWLYTCFFLKMRLSKNVIMIQKTITFGNIKVNRYDNLGQLKIKSIEKFVRFSYSKSL